MRSGKEYKIPVINFSEENLKPGSDSWTLTSEQVRHALEEYGCFEVTYHKFTLQLHNSIFGATKEFFDLPKETKMRKTSDRPGAFGYVAANPAAPYNKSTICESTGIDDPTTVEGAEYFTNIMWPQGNDSFRETLHSFSKLVAELYETSVRMVFESYGVNDQGLFDSFRESTFHLFRFFKYKALQTNEVDVLGAHTDCGFFSILHQNEVKGLQIKTKDGQWIDVKPSPSSFLVLAGDVLMAWSNDRVHSCEHNVIMKENKDRYSIVLFSFIKGVIHVPEELVDEEHPLQYKPIDCMGYEVFRSSKESRKFACVIKNFCGV
ncbi:Oxoglutarate/iron-dependent dioxygenase [Parasponia andersonii]|uniref:Oxoglutarate/iron-dependent dioxygenase n=1 Tax=Parasponia andersonii TaxID=3476 RepID=A0A2P5DXD7_PARAD|nr:Oxoglutarate/iron-dependent dioxygenase [Parasponia andersonii]